MPIATPTGSSRSAPLCRLPRRRTSGTCPDTNIPRDGGRVQRDDGWAGRFASGTNYGPARSGGNCDATATAWRADGGPPDHGPPWGFRGRAWVTTTQADGGAEPRRPSLRGDPAQSIVGLGTSRRGEASSRRLRHPCSRDALSAGACRLRSARTSSSMRLNRPSTIVAVTARATWCITATAAHSTCRCATPSGWPTPASRCLSAVAATQDRGDSTTRPVAQHRGGRIRHARVGRLVQHPAVTGTDRLHPAGGV